MEHDDATESALTELARLTGHYYAQLLDQGVGPDLAARFTSDWNARYLARTFSGPVFHVPPGQDVNALAELVIKKLRDQAGIRAGR